MTNNQFGNKPKRNPGSFSVSDNKLRIQNSTGQSSVLFEDISSITWRQMSIPNINLLFIGIFILFFGMMFVSITTKGDFAGFELLIPLLVGFGLIIYALINKIIWEDVIVETRGGMLLSYSVDKNQGQNEVNRIENARRLKANETSK